MVIRANYMTLMYTILLSICNLPLIGSNIAYFCILIISIVASIQGLKASDFQLRKGKASIERNLWPTCILICCLSIFNWVVNGITVESFERLVQLLLCYFVLYSSSNYKWNETDFKTLEFIVRLWLVFYFVLWAMSGFPLNGFEPKHLNGNAFGAIMYSYLIICSFSDKGNRMAKEITVGVMVLFIYFSRARSIWIALLTFFFCACLFRTKCRYKFMFLLMIAVVLVIPIAYMWLYDSEISNVLNALSRKYFDKNLFSGRQRIWGYLIELYFQRPILGYGFDASPRTLMGIDLSSHNWYLQCLLQMGVFGLALILLSFKYIWNILYMSREQRTSRLISAYMLGVFVWQSFEVTLTQNELSTGIMVWLILGIGVSRAKQSMEDTDRVLELSDEVYSGEVL